MGSKIPVDDFSPKTNANITTLTISIPLIPAFDNPNKKTDKEIIPHCKIDK
jgi:hypothetical protein